jgi:hypothetical protein
MLKLYSNVETIRLYFENELNQDSTDTLEKYKQKLQKEYMPQKGYGKARSGEARKIVLEFKKINKNQDQLIEIILFHTKMMLAFTNAYGDIDEPFYNTLASCYAEACKLIHKNKLQEKYQNQCETMIDETRNFGWGLTEEMESIYEEYFDKSI